MSEADLREKIAEVVMEAASCPRLCDWLAPERCACGHGADAILALIRPAIQAARVEALRPSISDDVVADAFADQEWMETDPLSLLDEICNYAQDMVDPGTVDRRPWSEIDIIVMGRIYRMAGKAHDKIAAQITEARRLGRLEGLREAEQIARGTGGARQADAAGGEAPPVLKSAFWFGRGVVDGANAIADAIAALIEKETVK